MMTMQNQDNEQLINLITAGDESGLAALLSSTAFRLDEPGHEGHTPLSLAAALGRVESVNRLLHHGAEPNIASAHGTPISLAARFGHIHTVRALLAHGAKVDGPATPAIQHPLWEAASRNQLDVLQTLVAAGAPIEPGQPPQSAIWSSVASGNLEATALLLSTGANSNSTDARPRSVLTQAAALGDQEIIKLLLRAGANIDGVADEDGSPLLAAAYHGHTAVVTILLDWGANPDRSSSGGHTPLHVAAQNGHVDVAQVLLARGANSTIKSHFGKTPVEEAKLYGHQAVADLLSAVESGTLPVVELLREIAPTRPTQTSTYWSPVRHRYEALAPVIAHYRNAILSSPTLIEVDVYIASPIGDTDAQFDLTHDDVQNIVRAFNIDAYPVRFNLEFARTHYYKKDDVSDPSWTDRWRGMAILRIEFDRLIVAEAIRPGRESSVQATAHIRHHTHLRTNTALIIAEWPANYEIDHFALFRSLFPDSLTRLSIRNLPGNRTQYRAPISVTDYWASVDELDQKINELQRQGGLTSASDAWQSELEYWSEHPLPHIPTDVSGVRDFLVRHTWWMGGTESGATMLSEVLWRAASDEERTRVAGWVGSLLMDSDPTVRGRAIEFVILFAEPTSPSALEHAYRNHRRLFAGVPFLSRPDIDLLDMLVEAIATTANRLVGADSSGLITLLREATEDPRTARAALRQLTQFDYHWVVDHACAIISRLPSLLPIALEGLKWNPEQLSSFVGAIKTAIDPAQVDAAVLRADIAELL